MKRITLRQTCFILMILFVVSVIPWSVFAETEVTSKVELIKSSLVYDRRAKTSSMNVSIKNISQNVLLAPIKVVISSVSTPDVSVTNADGVTNDGKPYFEYKTSDGLLMNGQVIPEKKWIFSNPTNARFSYSTKIMANGFQPPTVNIQSDPSSISSGDSSVLIWASTGAENCTISPNVGPVGLNGKVSVSPKTTTTYTITVVGLGGSANATCTITVTPTSNLPVISSFSSVNGDTPITQGESTTLKWVCSNIEGVTSVNIDPIGTVAINAGQVNITPDVTTTYTLMVSNQWGTASAKVTVMVSIPHDPLPEGSFGKIYEDLIPVDSVAKEYNADHFSLTTGLVFDVDGNPLEGVSVSVLEHPKYGTAFTDDKGRFSLPMDIGNSITLVYSKEGYLDVHRQVNMIWNDITPAESVVMLKQDPVATTITLDGNPQSTFSHISSESNDVDGKRSCSVVLKGDTAVYAVDANGNTIRELPKTITIRATEYTVGDNGRASMPANLPPQSAYTYCVDLSVDGVERVKFSKPVAVWVDNFLGFATGGIVPVGYYDRDKGVWVPQPNGVVVKLLDTDGDGKPEAVDAKGDGQPTDINGNGFFSDDISGLDVVKYKPGDTLWRFDVQHFSPWDCNWPLGFPGDAIASNAGAPSIDSERKEGKDCSRHTSSYINDRSRVLHQDIPVPGTDIALHYSSERTDGFKYNITLPVSGPDVPSSLEHIIARITVAGKTYEQIFDSSPLSNKMIEFQWDNLDFLGREIQAQSVTVHCEVGFVYDLFYGSPRPLGSSFGQPGLGGTSVAVRKGGNVSGFLFPGLEGIIWKKYDLNLVIPPKSKQIGSNAFIAEGWTITNHHQAISPTLFRGDGVSKNNVGNMIYTLAGNGTQGYGGDGGDSKLAKLYYPFGLEVDTSGNVFISDTYNQCVRKIDKNGIITRIAGTPGRIGLFGDGGPAIMARLHEPCGLAIDKDGNLFIADRTNHRIRKVDTNGIITTVAGKGGPGYTGDGGPAILAELNYPFGIAVDKAGNLYISGTPYPVPYGSCIRKVDTNGIITTVAGQTYRGYGGDDGPATEARLDMPYGVAVDDAGNIYIADTYNNRIRKVDNSGIITTVAGNGSLGYDGDGGPAKLAKLNHPMQLDLDSSGNLYFGSYNHCIRKVDANGIITTVAGNGIEGYSGDGEPANLANLKYPLDVKLDSTGNMYIADTHNHCIRKVFAKENTVGYQNGNIIPDDNGLGYIMDQTGRHEKTIDLTTGVNIYEFQYGTSGYMKLDGFQDRFGRYTTIQRDGGGTPTAIVSPDGITTQLGIGIDRHLTAITYPDNSSYTFTYTDDGLMRTKTEPRGNHFEYVYDTMGKLTDVYDHQNNAPFGHWHFYRHAIHEGDPETSDGFAAGDVLYRITSGEPNTTTYIDNINTSGYKSEITGPAGDKTYYLSSFDDLHVEKSLSCGTDLIIDYKLDDQYFIKYPGKIVEKFPSGLTRTTTGTRTYQENNADHAGFDRILNVSTVNGKTTSLTDDVVNHLRTVTTPMNRSASLQYDPVTLLPVEMQALGQNPVTYSYDNQGRPTVINSGERVLKMEYDDGSFNDRTVKATVTDINNVVYLVSVYHYDIMDRLWKVEQKDKDNESIVIRNTSYTYDKNGNMHILTKEGQAGNDVNHVFAFNDVNLASLYETPENGSYQYIYNKDRDLVRVLSPSGIRNIDNTYEDARLTKVQTPNGYIDIDYECSSKVSNMTRFDGSEVEMLSFGYDGKLLISEQSNGGILGQFINFSYNNDFNLNSMTYAGGTANLAYDNDGLLTSIGRFTISRDVQTGQPVAVTSAGLNMDFAFNSYGQLKDQSISVNGSPGYAWNLNHDNAGRIQSRTDTIQGSLKTTEYTYDEIGRLSAVMENGTETERYTYYPNGARATEINVHKGITVPRTYQYTREDQLTNAGNISYTYDADGFVNTKSVGGNTTVYTYSSLGELTEVALPDGNEINYVYDPLGRRIARKYNGAVTHKYLWQGQTRLLAVYDGSDNLLMRFEYASGRMPVAMTRAGVTYYLAYDQVGSLRLVTDSAGNTIKRIDYDSFGAIFNETNSGFSVPFGFAGGLYDKNTGLVRFGFRDYDPETGRWTAKDPIRFAGGDADLYGYVLNNPVNFVDSIGLITIPPWLKTALDLSGPNSPDLNVLRRWHKELLDQREGNWKAENIILDEIDNIYDMRSSLGSYNPCLDDLYFREERMKSLLENLILNTSDLNDRIQKSQRDIENFIEMTIKSGGKIIY